MIPKEIREEIDKLIEDSKDNPYKSGMLEGVKFASEQLMGGIEDAIRLGLEANAKGEEVTKEQIDSVLEQWSELMKQRMPQNER